MPDLAKPQKLVISNRRVVSHLRGLPEKQRIQCLVDAAKESGVIKTLYPHSINFAYGHPTFEIRYVALDRQEYNAKHKLSMTPGGYVTLLRNLQAIFAERLREQLTMFAPN